MNWLDPPGPEPPKHESVDKIYSPLGWRTALAVAFLVFLIVTVLCGLAFSSGLIRLGDRTEYIE